MAKTTDVDSMLSGMTHQQFDEWCAKDMIEPIGTSDPMCKVLAKIGRIIAAFMGHEMTDKDFLPWMSKATKQRRVKQLSPKQSAAAIHTHLRMLTGAQ